CYLNRSRHPESACRAELEHVSNDRRRLLATLERPTARILHRYEWHKRGRSSKSMSYRCEVSIKSQIGRYLRVQEDGFVQFRVPPNAAAAEDSRFISPQGLKAKK